MNSSSHVVHISNYSYFPQQVLGTGSTGSVYKGIPVIIRGIRNTDQNSIAVKVIKLAQINSITKNHLLACEVDALFKMNNPNVIKVYEILKDSEYYFIPMQYCENGTLREYIKKKKKLPVDQSISLFTQILEGYLHITQKNFIHRDLKTENVLLTDKMKPVIIDFGYCENKSTENQQLPYNVGSPAYMSPEAYNESRYSQKSDVWALGVMFHEMLTGDIPKINTKDVNRFFRELSFQKYAAISQEVQDKFCRQILYRALTVNQNQRCNCSDLLNFVRQKKAQEQKVPKNSSKKMPFYHPPHIIPKKKDQKHSLNLSYQLNMNQPIITKNEQKSLNTTLPDKKVLEKPSGFAGIRRKIQNSPNGEVVKKFVENQRVFIPVLKQNSGQTKISKSYSDYQIRFKSHRK